MANDQLAGVSGHYDSKYFDWQKGMGEFGGWANRYKFIDYLNETNRVLDFGCGGGATLAGIKCAERYGVEPNLTAAAEARKVLDRVFTSSSELPTEFVDIVISDNALEHTLYPLSELKHLYRCLVPKGKVVIVTPCENISYSYVPKDINHHLYSWSPMCLGNLLDEAGFSVIESKPYIHKWPPYYHQFTKFGWPLFNIVCRFYGQLNRKWFQVRAIATKGA